jgi:hypothetical protein
MLHPRGFAIALCAILLVMFVELVGQDFLPSRSRVPMRGMMWTEDDQSEPVGFSGGCPGAVLSAGKLTFTDYNIGQGYFEVGEFQGQLRPESPQLAPVIENRDKAVEIVLRVRAVPMLEKVIR